ncbi:MAG: hypothetical protein V3T17_12225 [Pseudomonadales bacterium]
MSQNSPAYNAGGATPATFAALKNKACALPYSSDKYEPPTPDEIDALIKLAGWSQNDAAKIVGVTYNPKKGSSTIRKWRAKNPKEYREIPYAAWRLMLLHAGVVNV